MTSIAKYFESCRLTYPDLSTEDSEIWMKFNLLEELGEVADTLQAFYFAEREEAEELREERFIEEIGDLLFFSAMAIDLYSSVGKIYNNYNGRIINRVAFPTKPSAYAYDIMDSILAEIRGLSDPDKASEHSLYLFHKIHSLIKFVLEDELGLLEVMHTNMEKRKKKYNL